DLDRILGRFGSCQGTATKFVVERHALARALRRRRLCRGAFIGLAAQRFLRVDARLQLGGRRRFGPGTLVRLRLAPLLGRNALAERRFGARFGLLALAGARRSVRFLARALLGGVACVGFCRLALARRLDRGRFRCRERLRALVQAVFRLGALPRAGGEGSLRRDARLRFGECARLDFLAFARCLREFCLGLQPLLGAAAQLGVHRLALAREARRVGLDVGAHVRRVLGRLLRRGLHLRRLERLGLGTRALARLLLGRELQAAALLGQGRRALLRRDARICLFQRAHFGCLALLRHFAGRRLCVGTRLRAPRGMRVLSLALAHRRRGIALGGDSFLGGAPRQLFGGRALAHRRGRLDLGLGSLARVLRGFFLLLAAALGQRRGLLLCFPARFRLGGRLRFGALALGDHARRLRLGFGARIGNAPQLDFRGLALTRHVQPALLLAQLRLRRLAGAALG